MTLAQRKHHKSKQGHREAKAAMVTHHAVSIPERAATSSRSYRRAVSRKARRAAERKRNRTIVESLLLSL